MAVLWSFAQVDPVGVDLLNTRYHIKTCFRGFIDEKLSEILIKSQPDGVVLLILSHFTRVCEQAQRMKSVCLIAVGVNPFRLGLG